MKSEIIGNPKIFAIEFTVEFVRAETVYGNSRIWIEGKSLGDISEYIYLGGICSEMESLPNFYYRRYKEHKERKWTEDDIYYEEMRDLYDDIPNITTSAKEFVKMFEENDLASVFSSEVFDRFYITYYWKGPKIVFYWCLDSNVAEDIENYPQFKDYPKEVQRAEVEISIMKQINDEFKAKIEKIIKENKVKK